MRVSDFLVSLRYTIKDTAQTTYSNPQLLDATNSVIRMINNELVKLNSSLVTKAATLTLTSGSTSLPTDFIAMVSLKDSVDSTDEYGAHKSLDNKGYYIIGNTLTVASGVTSLYMIYRYLFSVVTESGDIPLPDWFIEQLRKYVGLLVTGRADQLDTAFAQAIKQDVMNITSGMEYTYIHRSAPFSLLYGSYSGNETATD